MSQTEKPNTTSRLSRRDALAGLSVAAVAGVAALPAGAAEVDPIFAAIERYKAAVRTRAVALAAECDFDEEHDACDAEWEAFDGLFETPTTSIAGIVRSAPANVDISRFAALSEGDPGPLL